MRALTDEEVITLEICGEYFGFEQDETIYDHCFKPDADYSYALLPARPHDSQLLDDLLAGFQGVAFADKGFIDAVRQQELAAKRAVELITPPHKKMKVQLPVRLHRICQRWRKRIETVGSHLTGRFHLHSIRARDLWHYQNRLIRKVLAHTVCVFIKLPYDSAQRSERRLHLRAQALTKGYIGDMPAKP